VYLVPPESPHWALDAIAAGATTYLVKLPSCAVLFVHAAHVATARHAERAQLREALAALHAARHAAQDKQARGQAAPRSSPDDRRETLIETITRQLRSGDIVIPPYPNINAKLGKLVEEQADVPDIAALLRNDAAICSRLVAVSNSARYGTRREIKSLEQAVSLIGINETRRYVEVMSNQSLYVTRHARMQPLLKRLWEHSMAVAHASHAISRLTRVGSADELFMMGLLHDVGTLLLLQIIGDLEARGVSAESMPCDELEAFTAAQHGVFGKSVLDRWKFPERYGLVAVRHGAEVSDEHAHELLVVHFANRLAQNLGYSVYPKPPHDLAALASAKLLRLRADEVAQVEEQVKALVEAVKLEIV
jgi:HD-like signal output (HDOD) protein